jgi:multidrug efflux system membrane fusion protein
MNFKTVFPLSVITSALAVAGCSRGDAIDAPAMPLPQVSTAQVAVEELNQWADFTGRLEAIETVTLRPRVGGFIDSVHFEEGGRVEQGELLFRIDPRPYRAEVERLRAERQRAAARVEVARSYRERAERLLARNATSREEYERLVADAEVAEAELASVEAALEAAELNLSFTEVTAPIAGRVSRALVTPGNLVDPSTVLTTLVADEQIYAYFDIDEHTYLSHLEGSGEAAVYVGLVNEEGYPHHARLDFLDNRVDPSQGTIRARAVLDNSNGRFTPGLFARLKLVSPKRYRAALIEDRAIGTDLGRKFVFVVDEQGVVQYRAVEIGPSIGGLRVVKSGLEPGDEVIVNGLQRVRPGVAVAATQVQMDRSPVTRYAAAMEGTAFLHE